MARKCGLCKLEGHNRTKCPTKNNVVPVADGTAALPAEVPALAAAVPTTGRKCGLCKTPGHIATKCPHREEMIEKKEARAAARQAKIEALWAMVPDPDPTLHPVTSTEDPVFNYPNISWSITSNPVEAAEWGLSPDEDRPLLPPEIANRPLVKGKSCWIIICALYYSPLRKMSVMGFLMAIYIGKKYNMRLREVGDHIFYEGLFPNGYLMLGS